MDDTPTSKPLRSRSSLAGRIRNYCKATESGRTSFAKNANTTESSAAVAVTKTGSRRSLNHVDADLFKSTPNLAFASSAKDYAGLPGATLELTSNAVTMTSTPTTPKKVLIQPRKEAPEIMSNLDDTFILPREPLSNANHQPSNPVSSSIEFVCESSHETSETTPDAVEHYLDSTFILPNESFHNSDAITSNVKHTPPIDHQLHPSVHSSVNSLVSICSQENKNNCVELNDFFNSLLVRNETRIDNSVIDDSNLYHSEIDEVADVPDDIPALDESNLKSEIIVNIDTLIEETQFHDTEELTEIIEPRNV